MSFVRVHVVVGIDAMPRESALELGDLMLDVADVPGFIHGSAGITWHDDECDDPECRGCEDRAVSGAAEEDA